MLECGKNYRGTITENCLTCNVIDNEEHRLNVCMRFSDTNYSNDTEKIPLETIYSEDVNSLRIIIERIEKIWNVKTGHGTIIS